MRDIETDAMVHDAMIQDVDVMSRGGGGGGLRGVITQYLMPDIRNNEKKNHPNT